MIHIMLSILKKMRVPYFLHPKSKHTFSIHQHIILLVLRQYESKSYESFVEWLEVATEIAIQLQLKTIPHFTTLQKAAARLSDTLLQDQSTATRESFDKFKNMDKVAIA